MAVSLRKPNGEQHEADQSNPFVPENLREYTPVHLIDEEETIRSLSAVTNSDMTAAGSSNIIGALPGYDPVHSAGGDEAVRSHSTVPNSDGITAAKKSKRLFIFIILIEVIIIGVFSAMSVFFLSRGKADRSNHADVKTDEAASCVSGLEQSATSMISEPPSESTGLVSDTSHVYRDMDLITI